MSNISGMLKNMDWLPVKARLELPQELQIPNRKEIWWASLGQNVGVETNGKNSNFERPVVVIKVFNTESALAAPLTTSIKEDKYIYRFIDSAGLISGVNLSQLRTLSTKRMLRKMDLMSDADFVVIQNMIIDLLIKEETPTSGVSS